jgi:VWFA-related protein
MQTACTLIPTCSKAPILPPWVRVWLVATICSLALCAGLHAAQNSNSVSQLQSSTALVRVDVSVLDKRGNFVPGLRQDDFRLLDNGVEAPIVFFAPVEAPAQVLVMIETSPAVYLIQDEHFAAAFALLQGLAPDDEVAMVSYDETPRLRLPFTSDKAAFLSSLDGLQYTIGMGELNFYDSLSQTIDWLPPGSGKQAIVTLTTGLDSSPQDHWDALVEKLRRSDVVIFPVALGASLHSNSPKKSKRQAGESGAEDGAETANSSEASFAKADEALRSLAKITGGQAYFPESAKDFAPAYRQIAAALRHQYVLGVAPARDGQTHSLIVEILRQGAGSTKAPGNKMEYRVFAREGYLAPGP